MNLLWINFIYVYICFNLLVVLYMVLYVYFDSYFNIFFWVDIDIIILIIFIFKICFNFQGVLYVIYDKLVFIEFLDLKFINVFLQWRDGFKVQISMISDKFVYLD